MNQQVDVSASRRVLLDTDSRRLWGEVTNVGAVSVWIGDREVDTTVGRRLRPGQTYRHLGSTAIYAVTQPEQRGTVAVLDNT